MQVVGTTNNGSLDRTLPSMACTYLARRLLPHIIIIERGRWVIFILLWTVCEKVARCTSSFDWVVETSGSTAALNRIRTNVGAWAGYGYSMVPSPWQPPTCSFARIIQKHSNSSLSTTRLFLRATCPSIFFLSKYQLRWMICFHRFIARTRPCWTPTCCTTYLVNDEADIYYCLCHVF